MSLDKAILYGKEKLKPYRGSKAFDASCRCHGSCEWCRSDRLHKDKKLKITAKELIREWCNDSTVASEATS